MIITKEDFKVWFDNAKDFFIDYENAIKRVSYNKSAFFLH